MFKVIIVDDCKEDRDGMHDFINWEKLNMKVVGTAENGGQGFDLALLEVPDIVISDISMPVENGIEMSKKIKEVHPQIEFIFMTCHDDFKFAKGAIDTGAFAYVLKPIDTDELEEKLFKLSEKLSINLRKDIIEKELEKQILQNNSALQEQLLQKVFRGDSNKEELEKQFKKLNIHIKQYFCIISMVVDKYSNLYEQMEVENKYSTIYTVKNIIKSKLNNSVVLIEDESRLCVFFLVKNENKEDGLCEVLEEICECREWLEKELMISFTMCVSEIESDLSKAFFMHQQMSTIRRNFHSSENSIILTRDIEQISECYDLNFNNIKQELIEIFNQQDPQKIEIFVNRYYSENSFETETQIKSFSIFLVSIIQILVEEKGGKLSEIFGDNLAIWQKLLEFKNIIDIKRWIFNIIMSICQHLNNADDEPKTHKIVEHIKSIIDEDFRKLESVKQISDSVYISISYANRLFKKYTNQTIFDYLIEKKMCEAKRMLEDPYIKVYEVAEELGYKSKVHFSTLFKEHTGVLPKDYRKSSKI